MLTNNQCMIPQSSEYWQQVLPPTQNLNFLARYTRKLSPDWEVNVSASFFQSEDSVLAAFNPPFSTNATSGFGEQAALVNGKGIVNTYNTPGSFVAPVPANVAAQFGVAPGTLEPIQITLMDVGAPVSEMKTQTYRLVGELKGTAGKWDVNASYGWSEAVTQEINYGDVNLGNLYNALASGQYVPGTQNPASVISYVAPAIYSQFDDILWFADVHGNRDLIPLAGGNLSVATGVDFFFRSLDAMPSSQGLSGIQPSFAGDAYAEGNQSDWSVFGEIDAPVLKSLDLDAAVRYDKYNTYSPGNFTPKFGFKFTPITQVAIRGTASRGFRAPNPVETGSSGSLGFFGFVNDPILCPNPAVPNTKGNFPSQCNIEGTALTIGTAGLKPERSTAYTFGILLEPAKDQSFSVDFYDIKISDQIVSGLAVPSVVESAPIARGGQVTLPFCCNAAGQTYSALTPVGLFAGYLVPFVNLNSTETRGLEYEIKNALNLGDAGKLKSDIMWTYMVDYLYYAGGETYNLVGTHGPSEISGDTGTPRSRAKWIISWDRGPFDVTGTLNYIGPYSVTDPSAGPAFTTCSASLASSALPGGAAFPAGNGPSAFCEVSSFTDFDLYGAWQVDKHWNLHANIQNVFNREPPLDLQTYASTNFNPSLHMEGAIGRMYNVGFRYTW
jgi:iron complex outermembrane receptor protein